MSKLKLLIISTYNIKCGIASFTAALKSQLEDDFIVDIAVLDQDILKNYPNKFGDAEICRIIKMSENYDVVNLQLEWGTLGSGQGSIVKRFSMLMNGCSKMLLTLHTPVYCHFNSREIISLLSRMRFISAFKSTLRNITSYCFERKKLGIIKKTAAKRGNNFHIMVHTKRERKNLSGLHHIPNVHDHPLSNIHTGWPAQLEEDKWLFRSELLRRFGADAVLIGFYGFISRYKGLETLIEAVNSLPDNYKLLIFGSIHPQSIKKYEPINPYLAEVVKCVNASPSRTEKVFFMGSPDDYGFAKAVCAVDACVFPYLEVGQSASGPVSIAVELKRP
ncbi:MAG: hypothetical protein IJD04_08505, partial [Desulfovibrionaceae bacterium]|nr:hypothetical protein [Desulfovibrionaceae bacterium]